jgi:hypothetical protein
MHAPASARSRRDAARSRQGRGRHVSKPSPLLFLLLLLLLLINAGWENPLTFDVDEVVDDCMHLIALLYLTIGRNNEAPAWYVAFSLCAAWIYTYMQKLLAMYNHEGSSFSRNSLSSSQTHAFCSDY